MPLGRQRYQPSEVHLLPVLDPTSDFDSLWGDTGITHPLGSAYLGLYKTEVERIHDANDKISNLSSCISLVDDTLPRRMASVMAQQDDTNISFFEDSGLTLSPSSWLRSIRKKRRPRSALQVQPSPERLYSPSFKYRFSNTTDTPWRAGATHNISSGTIGSASGYFAEMTHITSSTDNFSLVSARKQSPSSDSNEGLQSRSSQSPVSVDSSEPESLPTTLVNSYRKIETVASQSQSHSAHMHDNFDSLDGKIIAVSPTCKVFTTEDEIFSDEEVPKWHGLANLNGAIHDLQDPQSRSKASVAKRSSAKRSANKSLVIATAQSASSLTSLKSPALSVKSVRFDIPENEDVSSLGDVHREAGLLIDISPSDHLQVNVIDYVTDGIYKNPWLEPNTPPPPETRSRTQSVPSSPGILRQGGPKHPSLAVTGIMRVPLTNVNKPKDTYAREANSVRTEPPHTPSQVGTEDSASKRKLPTLHELPNKALPPRTERSATTPELTAKPRIDPRDPAVNGKVIKPHRSKSLSDIPTHSSPIHSGQQWRNGSTNYPQMGSVVNDLHFI